MNDDLVECKLAEDCDYDCEHKIGHEPIELIERYGEIMCTEVSFCSMVGRKVRCLTKDECSGDS